MELLTLDTLGLFALLGATAGFLAGFLGIGGGIILVPLFLWVFAKIGVAEAVRVHLAFGTSLSIIIPTAVSAMLAHRKRGNLDWNQIFPLGAGGMLGSLCGSWAVSLLPGLLLKGLFGLMQMFIGFRMLASQMGLPQPGAQSAGTRPLGFIGLASGAFSSFFGVGGGVVAVPLMVFFGRIPIHRAVGNSSALIVLSSFFGTAGYVFFGYGQPGLPPSTLGYVHGPVFLLVAPMTILFARLGAFAASLASNRRLLQGFACLLILVGGRTLWSLL